MELGQHVGELEGDGLVLADRLPEGHALLRVAEGGVVGGAAEAHGEGPRHHADLGEDRAHLLDPARLAPQEVPVGNEDVVEEDLARGRGPDAQLVDPLPQGDAGELAVHEEEGDVLHPALARGLGADGQHVGDRRVGDPGLGALEPPAALRALGEGGDAGDVRAGVRLGEAEGRDLLPAEGGDEVTLPEVLRSVLVDEVGAHQALHGGERGERHGAPRQLLGEEAVGHHVGVGAAVGLGVAETQEALLGEAPEEGARELARGVEARGLGHDLRVHEAGDGRPERLLLRGQPEVHAGLPVREGRG